MNQLIMTAEYPFSVEQVWEALTTREALSEWLMDTDFELKVGHKFRFNDKPQGGWRGFMECEVLEFKKNEFLKINWLGMPDHDMQYVTFRLSPSGEGTRMELVHEPWNGSHGVFGGRILKQIIKFGWKRMFYKQLPPVLEFMGRGKKPGEVPAGLVNRFRRATAQA